MARASSLVSTTMLVATLLLFSTGVSAQAPVSAPGAAGPAAAPDSADDCLTLLAGMADCLSYVQKGSNLTVPEKPCCPELKNLVDTNPICLCKLLANSSDTGFEIDLKRATKLPSVCKVDTPPVSTCAAVGIPVAAAGAPLESQGLSPGSGPSEATPIAPSPIKHNGAKAVAVPSVFALLLVFALSFFSTFF